MTSMLPAIVFAVSVPLPDIPTSELEKIYWDCEYASTQEMLDFSDAAHCSIAYEQLKAEKFHNDFQHFLRWWKANKEKEIAARGNMPPIPR